MPHARTKIRKQRRREGAALLIVLFILMMATGTALFAVQGSQFEQRAAGSLYQAMRTKFVAEAATVGVLSLCFELGPACADLKRAPENYAKSKRDKYALPSYPVSDKPELVYELSKSDLAGSPSWKADLLPTDKQIAGGGTAMAYTPSFSTVMERWDIPTPGETRPRYRLIVSTYGQLGADVETTTTTPLAADEHRFGHESISATRAYIDVK
jgi:hypothetical protein